jgi:hypothetical protein
MTKAEDKGPKKAARGKPPAPPAKAAGAGFRKTFSDDQLRDIEDKRRAMRERLYAAG